MTNVLVGISRSKGSFVADEGKKNERVINFDNIILHLMDYNQNEAKGFTPHRNQEPVKIRSIDFYEIAGIKPGIFFRDFAEKYQFHRVRVIGENNDFGRFECSELQFSGKKCFDIVEEPKGEATVYPTPGTVEVIDPFDDLTEDVEDLAGFDLDEKTGEVKVHMKVDAAASTAKK